MTTTGSFRATSPGGARASLAALATAAILAGCAPGVRSTSAPTLQFKDFDYGFPVKTALADPRLAYIDVGGGPATLLLIHGLAANAGFWREVIPELARHYRVIAVDLPGYGRSEKSARYPYDMVFFAETLSKLIRELELGPVVPVGHSMGGQIALTLALRHPEQVRLLVLASPAGVEAFQPGEGQLLANALTVQGIRDLDEQGIRRQLSLNFYAWNDRWEWLVVERARMAGADEMDEFAHAVVRSVHGMLDQPTTARLEDVKQPTLLVYGRDDRLIPNPFLHPGPAASVFRRAAELMPDVKLVQLDGAGHMIILEKPAEFDGAVLQFLREKLPGAAAAPS